MNVLALGAHPDDVEFLCMGTLLLYRSQGHKVHIALTTSGNGGSNGHDSREEIAAVREAEQMAAADLVDAEVRFMRFDDEGLRDTDESRRAVLSAIRWADPDVILTNPPWDPSTDHGMTGELVTRMILSVHSRLIPADEPPIDKTPSVFFWDTPGGIDFQPEAYVDISNFIDVKLEAVSKHQSQIAWMGGFGENDFIDYCRTMARFRGIQAGCKYAEGFRAFRIHGFMADFHLLPTRALKDQRREYTAVGESFLRQRTGL